MSTLKFKLDGILVTESATGTVTLDGVEILNGPFGADQLVLVDSGHKAPGTVCQVTVATGSIKVGCAWFYTPASGAQPATSETIQRNSITLDGNDVAVVSVVDPATPGYFDYSDPAIRQGWHYLVEAGSTLAFTF